MSHLAVAGWLTLAHASTSPCAASNQVIPKAFQLLGVPAGVAVLSLVGLLTWYTINGLVDAAEVTGKTTYASVVRTACGKPAKWGEPRRRLIEHRAYLFPL